MIVFFFILNIIILILTAIKYVQVERLNTGNNKDLSEATQRNLCTIICVSLLLVFCIIFIVLYFTRQKDSGLIKKKNYPGDSLKSFFFSIIVFFTILSSYISWEFFVRNNYEEDKRRITFIVLIVLLFSVFHLLCNGLELNLNIPFKPRHIFHSFTL